MHNGVEIMMLPGTSATSRGWHICCCIIDEICHFGMSDHGRVKSDDEIVRSLTPATAMTGGKIICISTPMARMGWAYKEFETYWGVDSNDALVWRASNQLMNPTLSQDWVDKQYRRDATSARAEMGAQWRDDISAFISRKAVEKCVVKHRIENLPNPQHDYMAFFDGSGGVHDSAALCVGHIQDDFEGKRVIIDYLKEYKAPFSPQDVCQNAARQLRRFKLNTVTGDAYSAEWVSQAFRNSSISYIKSRLNKNQLYMEFLPVLSSEEIELLDSETLINQLSALQRFTRAGGNDRIDHPIGGKDDLCNAVAGCTNLLTAEIFTVGALPTDYATIF